MFAYLKNAEMTKQQPSLSWNQILASQAAWLFAHNQLSISLGSYNLSPHFRPCSTPLPFPIIFNPSLKINTTSKISKSHKHFYLPENIIFTYKKKHKEEEEAQKLKQILHITSSSKNQNPKLPSSD